MKKISKFTGVVMLSLMLLLVSACQKKEAVDNGDKPELRQLGFQRNFDPNEDPVSKMLEEETGYKVQYEILPMENYDDKLNLMMGNKEEIDIVKMSAPQYHKLAAEGALEPLGDLLKEYGTTLMDVNDEESWEASKIDGEIYGIPERAPRPFVGDALGIRKDILDEVGKEVPKTLDEFYELLIAIRDKTDYIPMTGFQPIVQQISGAFGFNAQWADVKGDIVPRIEREGMKEYIEFMQKLYAEGLIDSEWPVNDYESARDKFASGKAAIMSSYGWGASGILVPTIKDEFDTEIELIMGITGPNGDRGAWVEATGVSWYIGIPKASKHKEHAMQYLNMKVQPELFKKMTIGEEGVHWEKEGDRMVPILPIFNDERGNSDWFMTSTDQKVYGDYWILRTRKDENMGNTFEKMLEQVDYGETEAIRFAPPLESNAKYGQRLNEMESNYIINAIADPKSAENYEDFLTKWRSEGGEQTTNDFNDWYKTYTKQ
ncbi:extracellular solute-binding protein [Erysipelothrix urinaevulpis]|uniref:extracellular solute-binding protein n=1 Tax=Erysipelothrix urinaevulpis TaxID=2683717 RepID=UPI001356E8AC|nr:extracellular solute-binding protein [Erysipelothrix urinaevulpis]